MSALFSYASLSMRPIHGMVPPGGFHYFQGDVRLTADTVPDLYARVADYRGQNGLPTETVKADVDMYICGQFPDFCHTVDEVSVSLQRAADPKASLLSDLQTWTTNLMMSPRPRTLVGDELAEARASVCARCAFNSNWKSGCGSCVAAVDRASASLRQARDTRSTPMLGGCRILRHDNRTAVFLDPSELHASGDLPAHCWVANS
jgi:hypothetical protein